MGRGRRADSFARWDWCGICSGLKRVGLDSTGQRNNQTNPTRLLPDLFRDLPELVVPAHRRGADPGTSPGEQVRY